MKVANIGIRKIVYAMAWIGFATQILSRIFAPNNRAIGSCHLRKLITLLAQQKVPVVLLVETSDESFADMRIICFGKAISRLCLNIY